MEVLLDGLLLDRLTEPVEVVFRHRQSGAEADIDEPGIDPGFLTRLNGITSITISHEHDIPVVLGHISTLIPSEGGEEWQWACPNLTEVKLLARDIGQEDVEDCMAAVRELVACRRTLQVYDADDTLYHDGTRSFLGWRWGQ